MFHISYVVRNHDHFDCKAMSTWQRATSPEEKRLSKQFGIAS